MIGRGGGGVVFRAADRRFPDGVALKFTLTGAVGQHKAAREAAIMQKVRHPHVCELLEHRCFEPAGIFGLALELMNAGTLTERLAQHGGKLAQAEVVGVVFEMLLALKHVHGQEIVHRDVKPSNILRHIRAGPDGVEVVVHKLANFGIAVAASNAAGSPSAIMMTSTVGLQAQVGTPVYMSPEQFKPGAVAGPATDIWSLGVVMHQALTSQLPFAHDEQADLYAVGAAVMRDEPPDVRDLTEPGTVDDKVAELVLKALHKPADERFSSAAAMSTALEAALGSSAEEACDVFLKCRVWCEKGLLPRSSRPCRP